MERIKAQRIEGMKNMIMLGDGMMRISTIIKKIKEYNDLLEEAETAVIALMQIFLTISALPRSCLTALIK